MKPVLHWSHINMFTKCPEQYRRRYTEGEALPPGVNLICGTSVHKAAELDLTRKLELGELAPIEEVAEAARDSAAHAFEAPEGVFLTDEEREGGEKKAKANVIDTAVACASLYHTNLAPLAAPQKVERKWAVETGGFPFDLAGTIDCDDGDVIWDWKTAGKTPNADDAHTSGQATLYCLAKKAHDKVIPTVRFGYVVKTKTPKTIVHETRRTERDFLALSIALERMADAIDKQVFTFAAWMSPRPWWCSPKFCGYFNSCEGVCGKVSIAT